MIVSNEKSVREKLGARLHGQTVDENYKPVQTEESLFYNIGGGKTSWF